MAARPTADYSKSGAGVGTKKSHGATTSGLLAEAYRGGDVFRRSDSKTYLRYARTMARRRSSRHRSRSRSSRRPKKRRSSRRRPPAKRKGSGRLRYKHVKASLVKDKDPLFRGRIRLDRGAGVLEFPTPQQFKKIAREEGVPDEVVERAFGHLLRKRRGRKKKKRRRSSRRNKAQPLGLGELLFGWLG